MSQERHEIDRRQFVGKGVRVAGAAAVLPLAASVGVSAAPPAGKRRLVLVGTGSRGSSTWGKALMETHAEQVELVGLCDINRKRAEYAREYIGLDLPVYHSGDFEKMIRDTGPDAVLVTTTDCFHSDYVVAALELGCDAISEKPLATETEQCRAILEAERRSGRRVLTTFNARHGAVSEEIKKVLMSGELGRIISAEFHEYLDVDHGASYFRRWHGKKRFSGSLLVHKASHHFDQMNWWLEAEPAEVHAFGGVEFYGGNGSFRSRRCRGCPFQERCDFYWDITQSQRYMDLYVNCESEDGYFRDGCVWDNAIDTYDAMTVGVRYGNGTLLNYSLNAYMPYEGQSIAFNGEKGRLDVRIFDRQPWEVDGAGHLRVTRIFGDTRTWTVQRGTGGHGGADEKLKDSLFAPDRSDPLGQRAGSREGVLSSLIGIAARTSIETGERVKIHDLVEIPPAWPA
ncbi:MAG: Gfo/Idh/MocA family oxidoreductase [Acidobacteria bacterium]|nr:Gfo/Idh/MocA family oxidoreductase [Acidobacteriota bacterium]